jgi:hypothetical protein
MKEKLKQAMQDLKREIKKEVNPSSTNYSKKCAKLSEKQGKAVVSLLFALQFHCVVPEYIFSC